jgi:class 3 adenylate cyclase
MIDQKANKHRLAAIMATDVVGYSKLMQSDEAAALAALSASQTATQEHIELHQGRIANTAGDSVVAEFGSAVEAVRCAMALQEKLSNQADVGGLQVRIGIHLGDVVDKGGDLFGTAVNVAARLEGIAQPGGIVVSAAVRDAVAGKLAASFADLGSQTLKNIEGLLRAYALSPKAGVSSLDATLPLSLAWAWVFSAWVKASLGEAELAIQHATRATRLSPRDRQRWSMYAALGFAHFIAGRYTEALTFVDVAVREQPEYLLSKCIVAASAALAGRLEEAQEAMRSVRRIDPTLRISNLRNLQVIKRAEDFARWQESLRLAGLPE